MKDKNTFNTIGRVCQGIWIDQMNPFLTLFNSYKLIFHVNNVLLSVLRSWNSRVKCRQF